MRSTDVFRLCRLCLHEGESFTNIFKDNSDRDFELPDAIKDLLQQEVYQNDGFPGSICSECLDKLTDFKIFKEQCQYARQSFKNEYSQHKNIPEFNDSPVSIETDYSESIPSKTETRALDTQSSKSFCKGNDRNVCVIEKKKKAKRSNDKPKAYNKNVKDKKVKSTKSKSISSKTEEGEFEVQKCHGNVCTIKTKIVRKKSNDKSNVDRENISDNNVKNKRSECIPSNTQESVQKSCENVCHSNDKSNVDSKNVSDNNVKNKRYECISSKVQESVKKSHTNICTIKSKKVRKNKSNVYSENVSDNIVINKRSECISSKTIESAIEVQKSQENVFAIKIKKVGKNSNEKSNIESENNIDKNVVGDAVVGFKTLNLPGLDEFKERAVNESEDGVAENETEACRNISIDELFPSETKSEDEDGDAIVGLKTFLNLPGLDEFEERAIDDSEDGVVENETEACRNISIDELFPSDTKSEDEGIDDSDVGVLTTVKLLGHNQSDKMTMTELSDFEDGSESDTSKKIIIPRIPFKRKSNDEVIWDNDDELTTMVTLLSPNQSSKMTMTDFSEEEEGDSEPETGEEGAKKLKISTKRKSNEKDTSDTYVRLMTTVKPLGSNQSDKTTMTDFSDLEDGSDAVKKFIIPRRKCNDEVVWDTDRLPTMVMSLGPNQSNKMTMTDFSDEESELDTSRKGLTKEGISSEIKFDEEDVVGLKTFLNLPGLGEFEEMALDDSEDGVAENEMETCGNISIDEVFPSETKSEDEDVCGADIGVPTTIKLLGNNWSDKTTMTNFSDLEEGIESENSGIRLIIPRTPYRCTEEVIWDIDDGLPTKITLLGPNQSNKMTMTDFSEEEPILDINGIEKLTEKDMSPYRKCNEEDAGDTEFEVTTTVKLLGPYRSDKSTITDFSDLEDGSDSDTNRKFIIPRVPLERRCNEEVVWDTDVGLPTTITLLGPNQDNKSTMTEFLDADVCTSSDALDEEVISSKRKCNEEVIRGTLLGMLAAVNLAQPIAFSDMEIANLAHAVEESEKCTNMSIDGEFLSDRKIEDEGLDAAIVGLMTAATMQEPVQFGIMEINDITEEAQKNESVVTCGHNADKKEFTFEGKNEDEVLLPMSEVDGGITFSWDDDFEMLTRNGVADDIKLDIPPQIPVEFENSKSNETDYLNEYKLLHGGDETILFLESINEVGRDLNTGENHRVSLGEHEKSPESSDVKTIEPESSDMKIIELESGVVKIIEPESSDVKIIEPESNDVKVIEPESSDVKIIECLDLKQEVSEPTPEKTFSCAECRMEFRRSTTLDKHLREHNARKLLVCGEGQNRAAENLDVKVEKVESIEEKVPETPGDGVKAVQQFETDSDGLFRCVDCNKKFLYKSDLKNHRFSHGKKKSFQCDSCDKRFDYATDLRVHRLVHVDETIFDCNVCGKRLSNMANLRRHTKIHNGDKAFACDVCDKRFIDNAELKTHTLLHSGEKLFGCSMCQKKFLYKSSLTNHMKTHGDEKQHHCEICHKKFVDASGLKMHKLVHSAVKQFECPECGKKFNHKRNVGMHMRLHTGERPFACPECDKRFYHGGKLKLHMMTHKKLNPFACDECDKKFNNASHLKQHKVMHSDNKPFQCGICRKRFGRKGDLKTHVLLHDSEKAHECEECGKRFSHGVYLKRHQIVHMEERRFECEVCGKRFKQKVTRNIHQKAHFEEKPYQCEACEKKFDRYEAMRRHIYNSHTEERPFECLYCESVFGHTHNLTIHMKRAHKDQEIKCRVCGEKFQEVSELVVHREIHKGEKRLSCAECGKKFNQKRLLILHVKAHLRRNARVGEKSFDCEICGKKFGKNQNLKMHLKRHKK